MSVQKFFDINLRQYLDDIGQYPLLTEEEEKYFLSRLKLGDSEAREKIINSNLRLVIDIAKRYQNLNLPLLDIIQEGNLGLFKAVDHFDVTKGNKFSTYATYWIIESINKAIAIQTRNIQVPLYQYNDIVRYKKTVEKLKFKYSQEPTILQISKEMNISIDRVLDLYKLQYDTLSISTFIDEEEKTEIGKFLPTEEGNPELNIMEIELSEKIQELFTTPKLTDNEVKVLKLRFGIESDRHSQQETADKLSLTYQRIQQIEKNAIRKIKNNPQLLNYTVYMDDPDSVTRSIIEYQNENKQKKKVRKTKTKL